MIKKTWKALGDTRLTFWSLVATAILFFVGSQYANSHFEFFHGLNETRVQDWLAANLISNLSITWWLPVLLVALLVLGVNTFCCTVQRLAVLLPTRKQRPFPVFARDITPSIIHALFAVVMIGHLVTITMGDWRRVPLEKGFEISLGGGELLTIESVTNELFPPVEGQPRRIARTRVSLASQDGANLEMGHGDPLSHNGLHLILDRKKKKKKDRLKKTEENCNKEKHYRIDRDAAPPPQTLLIVDDPGVIVIFPAFTAILLLMGWFYVFKPRARR